MDNSSDCSLNYRSQNAGCPWSRVDHDPAERRAACTRELRISCVEVGLSGHETDASVCELRGLAAARAPLQLDNRQAPTGSAIIPFAFCAEQMNLTDGRVTRTPRRRPDYAENNTIE